MPEETTQRGDWEKGGALAIGQLDTLIGFHLRLASSAIYQDFMTAMSELALTPKQFSVLELIAANPGVSQIDIAGRLGMDRATMMALTNRLESRGFVERAPSRVDRRRQELRLTSEGKDVLAEARSRILAHERRFLERFSDAEKTQFFDLLKRVYAGRSVVDPE
ncbi:DNA-binding MarR family transcriptional regulator [Rhizobium sp. SG_E_25_P2]|uniref:MarR family winged helix-turn-helix transcriptional regulator n=1 Tax=Rhizobium sp. SG_E_25_P2 TaxID=2879942 RepID=UPI002474A605|nr:MarR family transcriptional regulator [Rhizobium sp. SG_E_25_P2]MDH6267167.1 DNA-binding MarR family transcriptional regulator [Rhizobium sp. SG_E_25_P2]